jgi:hypothetical protein
MVRQKAEGRKRDAAGRFTSAKAAQGAALTFVPGSSKLTAEAAPVSADTAFMLQAWRGSLNNPDAVLAAINPQDTSHYLLGYGLYEEMLDKDPLVRGLVSQRQRPVLAAPEQLLSASDDELALRIHAFTEAWLAGMAQWNHSRAEALMAVFYGVTFLEIDWQYRDVGMSWTPAKRGNDQPDSVEEEYREALVPVRLWSRRRGRFVYSTANELRLLTGSSITTGEDVPARKFIDFAPNKRYENPYGEALARVLYHWHNFKRHAAEWRTVDIEKYGSPFVAMGYDTTATDADKTSYRRALNTMKRGSGLLVPKELLESMQILNQAHSTSDKSPHEAWCDFCDKQMAIAYVGQTLTTQQGDKGARSLGEVHQAVAADIVQADARALQEPVQRLINWAVELNFGPDSVALAPQYNIETNSTDVELALKRFTEGRKLVSLSKRQVRTDLQLEDPLDEEDAIEPQAALAPFAGMFENHEDTKEQDGEAGKAEGERQEAKGKSRTSDFKLAPIQRAQYSREAHAALRLASAPLALPSRPTENGPRGPVYTRDEELLAASTAGLRELLPDLLQPLFGEGVGAASAELEQIPAIVRDWVLERLKQAGYGPDDAMLLDPALLGWDNLEFPETMKDGFRDRLNDDLSIASLLGREAVKTYADANAQPQANGQRPKAKAAQDNPLVEALFGSNRIIPHRVLSVANRMVRKGLQWEDFYKLDALSRSASFTAWDLLESDVRHIGGALQDALNWGYTCQQFADYLYNRLKPRYVQQGDELHAWHVETIYHTNFAKAYNQAQSDEAWELRDDFPFARFLNPDPQYATCVEMSGKVWRVDSATFRSHNPPLHFNCGSSWALLTDEMLSNSGLSTELSPPDLQPELYSGPGGLGTPARFGAWAPLEERYAHLEQQMKDGGVN